MNEIQSLLENIMEDPGFRRLVISNRRKKSTEYTRVMLRPVKIRGEIMVQAEYTYPRKVMHENLSREDALSLAVRLVTEEFKQINAETLAEDIQILANKPESPRVTRKAKPEAAEEGTNTPGTDNAAAKDDKAPKGAYYIKNVPEINYSNNRTKNYIIPDGVPCDFLIRLGVMGEDGRVFRNSYSKFRQINRYLEIVEDCYPFLEDRGRTDGKNADGGTSASEKPLRIIDFGCGKAYLTFALYHYLKEIRGRNVEIIGLDLKEDVIGFCNGVARDLGYDELKFLMGDIADYTNDRADMVVTLHACDTATDYALMNAVSWGTKVILSVPCCQHELFRQIRNDVHQPMLKHGILKDRLTEYLTDGLRGLKLEAAGYDVSMIEFTSLEHTARNIMIKAVKGRSTKAGREKAEKEFETLCEFYGVKPTIARMPVHGRE